jgi:hypothetical protein
MEGWPGGGGAGGGGDSWQAAQARWVRARTGWAGRKVPSRILGPGGPGPSPVLFIAQGHGGAMPPGRSAGGPSRPGGRPGPGGPAARRPGGPGAGSQSYAPPRLRRAPGAAAGGGGPGFCASKEIVVGSPTGPIPAGPGPCAGRPEPGQQYSLRVGEPSGSVISLIIVKVQFERKWPL